MLPQVFRAQDHETMDDFSPLPTAEGGVPIDYTGEIVKSGIKQTKASAELGEHDQSGKRLNMTVKILDGPEGTIGRSIFIGLNIVNPNPIAVENSMKELRSLSDACGVAEVVDSTQLHSKPFGFNLKLIPASNSFPAKNEISKYFAIEGGAIAEGVDPFAEDED